VSTADKAADHREETFVPFGQIDLLIDYVVAFTRRILHTP